MNPHMAAVTATTTIKATRCIGPSDPISPDPTTVVAQPVLSITVCDQSEREALAVCCIPGW